MQTENLREPANALDVSDCLNPFSHHMYNCTSIFNIEN